MALLALLSAFAYGSSDFLAGVAARRVPVLRATTATYLVGTVALAAVTFLLPFSLGSAGVRAGVWAGIAAAVGLLTFYAVLASGPMGVLSPAIAVLQAAVPVGVGVTLGERIGGLGWTGVALALVAAALLGSASEAGADGAGAAARASGSHWSARTVALTLVSGVALGLSVVALHQAPAGSGLVPALVDLVVGLALLVAFESLARSWRAAARLARVLDGADGPVPGRDDGPVPGDGLVRRPAVAPGSGETRRPAGGPRLCETRRPTEPPAVVRLPRPAVGAGLLMAAGQGLLALALQSGDLAVVAALLATYPLATVILARLALGERFGRRTGVGVGAAIAAAALLASG